ncbi:lachesin-like [Protopterus annectens]|uniref:lachesin-like n=1 Tax=Protopterus annectens TaxID=7888 RepID=UPI001CFAF4EA|nr:lachesin-like [Protopterus annectens]
MAFSSPRQLLTFILVSYTFQGMVTLESVILQPVAVCEGQTVTIPCKNAFHNTTLQINWNKNDGNESNIGSLFQLNESGPSQINCCIHIKNSRFSLLIDGNQSYSLKISDVHQADSGNYTCAMTGTSGVHYSSLDLQVLDKVSSSNCSYTAVASQSQYDDSIRRKPIASSPIDPTAGDITD